VIESGDLDAGYVEFKQKKFYVMNKVLRIKEEGVNSIDEIKGLDKVKDILVLDLSYNSISKIKNLEHFTNLKELSLTKNQIETIEGLETLTNLESLRLSYNRITEIKGLESLTNLKKLSLDYNGIPDLKGIGHLDKLEYLCIRLPEYFWNDLKKLIGDDFYREIGVTYQGIGIQNVKKVVEYCKKKDDKINTTDLKLEDIVKALSDGNSLSTVGIAAKLNRKDKWDTEVIKNLLWTNKELFVARLDSGFLVWKLK
jgi:Leucine-rich repeat (LRR) protein